MPDTEFIGLILLLTVAVMFGYFYFKKAERRDHPPISEVDDAAGAPIDKE
ncbi:MAG: hypothetical protein ABI622_01955 [Chloroflexota bacterium]